MTHANPSGGMRNVWILTACMTSLSICYTMLVPFLPLYLLDLGVEVSDVPMWSGVVFSITFLVAGIMAPIWGRMADTKGKKIMAIRAGIFIGIAYALTGFVQTPWELFGTRALMGFANGFMPASMTMVSLSVPKEKTGTALGIFQTGLIIGNVIGPSLGGMIEAVVGMRPVFIIAGVVLFIASAVVYFFVKEPVIEEAPTVETTSFKEDWAFVKERPVLIDLLWLYFIMQAAILMLQPILALYVGHMQGTMEGAALLAGMILSIGGVAGAITTNIWSYFGQKKGYFRAVCYALTGTGIFLLLQSMPLGIYWFGSLQILVGCFIVGVNPLLSAAVAHYTEPSFRGRVFGMSTMANQFGCMVGPLFASGVTTAFGIRYVFLTTGALLLMVAWMVYKRRVRATAEVTA